MVMSNYISGVLLVLKYATTTYDSLFDAMKQIDLVKASVLGFVMNEIDYSHRSRYSYNKYYGKDGYGYGYGYGYRSESESSEGIID